MKKDFDLQKEKEKNEMIKVIEKTFDGLTDDQKKAFYESKNLMKKSK